MSKGIKFTVLSVTLLLIVGVIVYAFYFKNTSNGSDFTSELSSSEEGVEETTTEHPERVPPEGVSLYRSDTYDFSLFYPESLEVSEHREGGGARTIVFSDAESGLGFQIFALPYGEEQITDERFRMDVPSGVRENLQEGTVDGATAAHFNSRNQLLGDTYEIWFINNGYLYEVTTLKQLGEWLDSILATWKFE